MKKLLYIFLTLSIISCTKNQEKHPGEAPVLSEIIAEETINLSAEQIELAGILTDSFTKRIMHETITCSGIIEVHKNKHAYVSPTIAGTIGVLNYMPGDKIEKGTVLAKLHHPGFIILQQQYIEAKSQVDYYTDEFKRQGELTVENASSIKNMQKAKADFLTSEALYKSLKSQLKQLGVNPERIEKGDFVTDFDLIAPISGVISSLNANIGKHISPDEYIYEIIDNTILYINLKIFEKDISKIKTNQAIAFHLANNPKKYETQIRKIGVLVNKTDRTTEVYASIQNNDGELKPGMHIEANISIQNREVHTLPSEAIVDNNKESFIFLKEKEQFVKIKIKRGVEHDGYCEVSGFDSNLLNSEVVISGTYYLMSALLGDE